jgi:hypothetical protein
MVMPWQLVVMAAEAAMGDTRNPRLGILISPRLKAEWPMVLAGVEMPSPAGDWTRRQLAVIRFPEMAGTPR